MNNQKENTLAITIPEKEKKELITDVTSLVKQVGKFKIVDDKSREKGSIILSSIKKITKTVEDKKDAIIKPINNSLKLIRAEFEIILKPLKELEVSIKNEIARDYREQEAIRAKVEAKARAEEQKRLEALKKDLNSKDASVVTKAEIKANQIQQKAEEKIEAVAPVKNISTAYGNTQIKKRWTYEVVDIEQVPRAYLELSSVAVNTAIRTGIREIPGLKIFETTVVAGS